MSDFLRNDGLARIFACIVLHTILMYEIYNVFYGTVHNKESIVSLYKSS